VLLICSGPDTWHARQKARELVEAFKEKYDKSGYSTEVIVNQDLRQVLSEIGAPSIFCPKRLIRFDGLLNGIKSADLKILAKRLKEDGENNVIVTVEDEPPAEKILKDFVDVKVVSYESPALAPALFKKWCLGQAAKLGVEAASAEKIADRSMGDTWMAICELEKFSVNKDAPLAELDFEGSSVYDAADACLAGTRTWREQVRERADEQIFSIILNQTRSAIKVNDDAPVKIPFFAVKKMRSFVQARVRKIFFSSSSSIVGIRSGLMGQNEADTQH
jgi:hypothetical protein